MPIEDRSDRYKMLLEQVLKQRIERLGNSNFFQAIVPLDAHYQNILITHGMSNAQVDLLFGYINGIYHATRDERQARNIFIADIVTFFTEAGFTSPVLDYVLSKIENIITRYLVTISNTQVTDAELMRSKYHLISEILKEARESTSTESRRPVTPREADAIVDDQVAGDPNLGRAIFITVLTMASATWLGPDNTELRVLMIFLMLCFIIFCYEVR